MEIDYFQHATTIIGSWRESTNLLHCFINRTKQKQSTYLLYHTYTYNFELGTLNDSHGLGTHRSVYEI